jgi:hypothetical protein
MNKQFLAFAVSAFCSCSYAQNVLLNPSASQTVSQPSGTMLSVNRLEGIRYADQFPGSDIGAKINAAYADCPGAGCRIRVPAGNFVFSTSIACSVLNKPCVIEGDPGGLVTLTYSGTATAVTLDWGSGHLSSAGIRDIALVGPGQSSTAKGVVLGATNSLDQAVISGLLIQGFGTCIENDNNSFLTTIEKSSISRCNKGLDFVSGSENTRLVDCLIFQNAIGVNIPAWPVDLYGQDVSFDDNTTVALFLGVASPQTDVPSSFQCFGCHFENAGGGTAQYVTVPAGNARVEIYGGQMLDDVSATSPASPQFISFAGMYLTVHGTEFWSAGRPKPQIVDTAGAWQPNLMLEPTIVGSGVIAADYTPGYSAGRIWDVPNRTDVSTPVQTARLINYDLIVSGSISKGSGSFLIDHPMDPKNKYLEHSFVESPDMLDVYTGTALLDSHGEAGVRLPDYFQALNRDFRYELTCIGAYAPVFIKKEISNNEFTIAGGRPKIQVSWIVTGVRKDAYAIKHPIVVERDKPESGPQANSDQK